MLKDGGNNLIFYVKTIVDGKQIFKTAIMNVSSWVSGKWVHLAFSWKDGEIRMYINGEVVSEVKNNFLLNISNFTSFNLFNNLAKTFSIQSFIDEFRISSKVRSASDIFDGYLKGLNLGTLSLISNPMDTIQMYESWIIYLFKKRFWNVPQLYLTDGKDTLTISNEVAKWTVSDTSILKFNSNGLVGSKRGQATLSATLYNKTITFPVSVKGAAKDPTHIEDPFLRTPANCAVKEMPVVIIAFIPTTDSINLDLKEAVEGVPYGPNNQTVKRAEDHILGIMKHTKFSLEEGSKYRGYKNSTALPYLGYKIIDYMNIYEPVPRGFPTPDGGAFAYDFFQILDRINGKYYVDSLGVKEFWVVNVHSKIVIPTESNMSSPTTPNISNSLRREDDMPKYSKTYYMYNYNMGRTGNEAVHNHGHQLESMCTYVAEKQDGDSKLFWRDFVGYNSIFPNLRNGDTHHTPNSASDYDYFNSTPQESDILDWIPSGGKSTQVSKTTWDTLHYNWLSHLYPNEDNLFYLPNAESNWYIMWMQSFAGYGNKIPYKSGFLTNWWEFVYDWDKNYTMGLHKNNAEIDVGLCSLNLKYSLPIKEVCAGGTIQIPYNCSQELLKPNNVFLVELSDEFGSMKFPQIIGMSRSNLSSGFITATFPKDLVQSNKYRIQISNNTQNIIKNLSEPFNVLELPDMISTEDETCVGACDGIASIVPKSNYTFNYTWDFVKSGIQITNLCPGDHKVVIRGNYGCEIERVFSIGAGKYSKSGPVGGNVDILNWINTKKAVISTSNYDIGNFESIFDNNPNTLLRSANINPMTITIEFLNPVITQYFNVNQGFDNGWFTLEAANSINDLNTKINSYTLIRFENPTLDGIEVKINQVIKRKIFRLIVKKNANRDNFVHLLDWFIKAKESYQIDLLETSVKEIKLELNDKFEISNIKLDTKINNAIHTLENDCINWKIDDTSIVSFVNSSKNVLAKRTGKTNLTAQVDTFIVNIPVTVSDFSTTNSSEIKAASKVNIFPNPSAQFLMINSNEIIHLKSITDAFGKQYPLSLQNKNDYSIDISHYPSGVYFLLYSDTHQNNLQSKFLVAH